MNFRFALFLLVIGFAVADLDRSIAHRFAIQNAHARAESGCQQREAAAAKLDRMLAKRSCLDWERAATQKVAQR